MKYKQIEGSDLVISQICLGTMTFGNPVSERKAISIIHRAIDLGINIIDTANIYEGYRRLVGSKGGVAESILGRALDKKRNQVILMTKVGNAVGHLSEDQGLSQTHIFREIDKSLRRLRTDVIDLYLLHRPDPNTPIIKTVGAINALISMGKVRYYGISNFPAEQIKEILSVCNSSGFPKPVVSQPPYSLLRRDIEKTELHLYQGNKISVIPYQALQGGLLTGKYHRHQTPPPDSRKTEKPTWMWDFDDSLFDKLETIEKLAESIRRPLNHYALAWVLTRPNVVSTIIGVKKCQQLDDNMKSLDLEIPQGHFPLLDQLDSTTTICP